MDSADSPSIKEPGAYFRRLKILFLGDVALG